MGFWAAAIPAAISAASSIAGGFMSGQGSRQRESKTQKMQRHLLDELLNSLKGDGPYSDLYKTDYDAFNRSYIEPAQAMFRNQIAPQIQQQYIAHGQQRGTGLDDQLLRAGVDLDSMLNSAFLEYQNQGKDRMQSTINAALGMGSGAPKNPSSGDNFKQSLGGYLSSDAFSQGVTKLSDAYNTAPTPVTPKNATPPTRKGFAPDWRDWKLGDPRWNM